MSNIRYIHKFGKLKAKIASKTKKITQALEFAEQPQPSTAATAMDEDGGEPERTGGSDEDDGDIPCWQLTQKDDHRGLFSDDEELAIGGAPTPIAAVAAGRAATLISAAAARGAAAPSRPLPLAKLPHPSKPLPLAALPHPSRPRPSHQ